MPKYLHDEWIKAKDALWEATEGIFTQLSTACKHLDPKNPLEDNVPDCAFNNRNIHVCAIEICPLLIEHIELR